MRVHAALLAVALAAAPSSPLAQPPPPGTLTRAPELVEFVPAEYPPEAAAAGVEGSVVLSIVIDEDGSVRQAVIVDPGPHPAFGPAALHAVQQFRFLPAEIDGAPAAVEIEYRYEFVLRRAAPPPPREAPVVLTGRVVERGTRAPVPGATVEAEGAVAETGPDGRFELRGVPPGEAVVRVVSPEHEPLSVTETIEAGRRRDVEYRVSRRAYDPYEAVVRGERERREVSVHTVETEEVRTVPGTQGDTLKILQNLPGVARAPFGIGLLVVRGSEPAETVVYVDGVPIPLLFHFGGLTSVVNADVVDAIDFFPGNFAPRYGRALGGTVELRTAEAPREWHGAAQIDVFDGRVQVEGPVGRAGSGYAAVRRSWIDAVLAVALPRIDEDAANDLRVAPRYYDYQAKLSAPLLGGQGSVFAYGSDDLLTFVQDDDQPGRPTFKLSTLFHRGGVSFRRPIGPVTNDLVVAAGRDSFDILRGGAFGLLTDVRSLTARDTLSWRPSPALRLEAGADLLLQRIEYSVYAAPNDAPGAVGDEFDEAPTTVAEEEAGTWFSPAIFAEADWRPTARLRLLAGLRADWETRFGRTTAWVDPRASAFYDLAPGTTLFAGAGVFGSAPDPGETSPTFGNPELEPERALHLALGLRRALPFASRLELTGFYKRLWSLVVPTRELDGEGRSLRFSNEGRGRTFGTELLLRRELARGFFGWLAWTWSVAERIDDPSVPPYGWHPFVLDQTHVLALVLSYRLPGDWILGTRVRAVSGNPYTPADGRVLDADTGRVQCLPSARRLSGRYPGFFQADARIDKRFVFERWMLSAYLDLQNVTNRENTEFRLQGYDCSEFAVLPSLPVFPAIGLRAEW